jgi:hypothetical protein
MAKAKPKLAPIVEAPPPKPARPLDNGEKAAFEATCAKARVFLCEAMLAAPIGPEKTRAKDAYVAFAEVAIAAKAGRGWEPGLLDELVRLQEEVDTLRLAAEQSTRVQPKAERHEVDLGPLNEAPPPVEGRRRKRPGRE